VRSLLSNTTVALRQHNFDKESYMVKRKYILSGLIVLCTACIFLAVSYSEATNIAQITASASEPVRGITPGRARALVAAAVGLISVVVGGVALRSAKNIGSGRAGLIVALVLGLIGMILSVLHLAYTTGGFGTGSGRAGAIVGLVLGVIGISLGGKALRRSHHTEVLRQQTSKENKRDAV
jgi:hypothetical protein